MQMEYLHDLVEEEAGLDAGLRGCQVGYGRHPSLASGGRARLCNTVNRPSGAARATSMPPRVAAKNKPSCSAATSCNVIAVCSTLKLEVGEQETPCLVCWHRHAGLHLCTRCFWVMFGLYKDVHMMQVCRYCAACVSLHKQSSHRHMSSACKHRVTDRSAANTATATACVTHASSPISMLSH